MGTTKLPIVAGKVPTLPTWPRHINTTQEFMDFQDLSKTAIQTKLREKYCKFLENPEGLALEFVTNKSVARELALSLAMVALFFVLHHLAL